VIAARESRRVATTLFHHSLEDTQVIRWNKIASIFGGGQLEIDRLRAHLSNQRAIAVRFGAALTFVQ
jgi:hypothetical protein